MNKYTPEEIKFIKANYRKLRTKEIAETLVRATAMAVEVAPMGKCPVAVRRPMKN